MATYTDGAGMGTMTSEETMMVMMPTMNGAPMFESETDTRCSRGEHGGADPLT